MSEDITPQFNSEIFSLYEKLYFHEIEVRERLNARLQTPLTLIVSFVGALAFLLQSCDFERISAALYWFYASLTLAAALLISSAVYFVKSWWGNTYSFLPSAKASEEYRKLLVKTYEPYENGSQIAENHFFEYIKNYYIEHSSANTECNDRRSIFLHKTNGMLIATATAAFVSFLIFYFFGLDKTSVRKPLEVKIVSAVSVEREVVPAPLNRSTAEDVIPPLPLPPPPPPPRQIKEGVEVVVKKPGGSVPPSRSNEDDK